MSQHSSSGHASGRDSTSLEDMAQHCNSGRVSGRESPGSEESFAAPIDRRNSFMTEFVFELEQHLRRSSNEKIRCEYPPLAAESEIRLLSIDPSDSIDSSDPVRCTFINHALVPEASDSTCRFDALSYTWGRPDLVEAILLNGERFWVTENLVKALKMLRYKMKAETGLRPLWVDAVCINQDNVMERSQQVLLMRDIYSRAHLVHIWLGIHAPRLEAFFTKWNQLLEEDEAAGYMPGMVQQLRQQLHDVGAIGPSAVDMLDRSDGTYDALKYLVSSPWWSRVWVQQEVLLAKTPIFHLDRATYRFGFLLGMLFRVHLWCLHQRPIFDLSTDEEVREGVVGRLQSIVTRYFEQTQRGAFSKWEMVQRTVGSISVRCEATDPRDRVYGLLGLLPPDIGILPDYTASVDTVFEDAGYQLMKWSNSLDVLFLHGSGKDGLESAPTWIPQFKRSMPEYQFDNTFNPSYGSTCFLERRKPGVLTVRAFQVDRVLEWSPSMNDILGEDGYLLSQQDRLRCVLRAWKKLAERTATRASFSIESNVVFWRAVIQQQKIMVEEQAANPKMTGETSMVAAFQEWLDDDQQAQSEHTFRAKTWLRLGESLHGERFLITEDGRYGTATIREEAALGFGDVIVILAGCSYPFILREVPGQEKAYTIVCRCYCDGKLYLDAFKLCYCDLSASCIFQLDCGYNS